MHLPAAVLALLAAMPLTPAVKTQLDEMRREIRAERFDRAIELGEALTKAQPSCSPCHGTLGSAYGGKALKASLFTQMSLAKKCRGAFEKAVELDPTSLDALFNLLSYYRNAPGIAGGGLDKARDVAERIAKVSAPRGHLARASILEKEKEIARAEAEYRKAVEADPKEAALVSSLASFLNRQKRPAEALETCRKAAAENPGEPLFKYNLGRIVAVTGLEPETGLKALEEYIAAPASGDELPTAADARWRRGTILEKQGKKAEARAEYEAALALEPGHPSAARELEKLRKG